VVKTLRIPIDEIIHERLEKIKNEAGKTWEDVLHRGVESIEEWPDDKDWNKAILARIDEKAELA